MPEGGRHDFPIPRDKTPVDPDNKHLSAALKTVVEKLKPSQAELDKFSAKLSVNCVESAR